MTEKRALGRGLAALISSQRNVEGVLKKEIPLEAQQGGQDKDRGVLYLETSSLLPNRYQPRQNFDDEQLRELVESVREKGVLAPILVRRIVARGEARGPERYEIIAGERRWRAAKVLKLERVPAVIRDADDKEALVLSIVENIQRQELNPIEEARAFERLMKEFSFTQETIARAVSKDRSSVANILRLLNLPEEIQKAIGSGRLSPGHGKVLLGLTSVPEQVRLTRLVLSNTLSVRELENYIETHRPHPKQKKTKQDQDPYVADLERELRITLGTKVSICDFKKRGKIIIEYYSPQDRERVLKILKK